MSFNKLILLIAISIALLRGMNSVWVQVRNQETVVVPKKLVVLQEVLAFVLQVLTSLDWEYKHAQGNLIVEQQI